MALISDYDFNIYCDGKHVSAALYQLRYDKAWDVYETNSSKYVTITFDMSDPDDHNVIAFLLRDYAWDLTGNHYTDYDTWEDITEYKRHAPKVLTDFFENYMIEYECEEYNA